MPTETKTVLVEQETREGRYGMACTTAVIDHPKHGRLLLRQGYGGEDGLSGGAYRWTHGLAVRLQPGDTLDSLRGTGWGTDVSLLDAILHAEGGTGYPVLEWSDRAIEAVASQAGV